MDMFMALVLIMMQLLFMALVLIMMQLLMQLGILKFLMKNHDIK